MSRVVTVTYSGPSRIHTFRNFAEEISLSLKESGWGALPMIEADSAINQVSVRHVPARKVRRVLSLIDKSLKQNGFADGLRDVQYDVLPEPAG